MRLVQRNEAPHKPGELGTRAPSSFRPQDSQEIGDALWRYGVATGSAVWGQGLRGGIQHGSNFCIEAPMSINNIMLISGFDKRKCS